MHGTLATLHVHRWPINHKPQKILESTIASRVVSVATPGVIDHMQQTEVKFRQTCAGDQTRHVQQTVDRPETLVARTLLHEHTREIQTNPHKFSALMVGSDRINQISVAELPANKVPNYPKTV
jgi:hypothetical protein